jgi:hypothetical protein
MLCTEGTAISRHLGGARTFDKKIKSNLALDKNKIHRRKVETKSFIGVQLNSYGIHNSIVLGRRPDIFLGGCLGELAAYSCYTAGHPPQTIRVCASAENYRVWHPQSLKHINKFIFFGIKNGKNGFLNFSWNVEIRI